MNKQELKELINNIKVGDTYTNLKIEELNRVESDAVLQELARKNNLQFEISIDSIGTESIFIYTVINPSKKFLNKEGQYKMSISKKAIQYLNSLE